MKLSLKNYRLIISLALFLAIFSYTLAQTTQPFPDVPTAHPNFNAISYLKSHNLIDGYSDKKLSKEEWKFLPEQKINRVEALKIIVGAFPITPAANQQTSGTTAVLPFSDIKKDAWYISSLDQAVTRKMVAGYPDGSFKPGREINLAEALKIILLAAGIETNKIFLKETPYPDVATNLWFSQFSSYAKDKHLIWPQGDGSLHADRLVSRAELSEIIYRLLYIRENKLDNFDISLNWPTLEKLPLYLKIKYPRDFAIKEEFDHLIFLRQDATVNQPDYWRLYPNAASVRISLLPAMASQEKYLAILKSMSGSVTFSDLTISNLPAIRVTGVQGETAILDSHIILPNQQVLVLYGSYGMGPFNSFLREKILAMENSFTFVAEGGVNPARILEEARKNILIDGQGKVSLDLFPDEKLIETDAIGVGTGPVDYYYSELTKVTLKFERSFDVILAIKEGKTTGF